MLAHAGSVDETWSVVMIFAALWAGWAGWSRLKDRGFPRLPRAGAYGLMGLAGLLVLGALFLPRAILGPPPPAAVRPTTSAILSIVQPTEGASVEGDELTVVVQLVGGRVVDDLAEGTHEIEAEFVAADHGSFDPPVTATATFVKASP